MPSPLPRDPTRLLVAGDTQGNSLPWAQVLFPAACERRVIGLSYDGTRKSWLVLDLPGLRITHEAEGSTVAI